MRLHKAFFKSIGLFLSGLMLLTDPNLSCLFAQQNHLSPPSRYKEDEPTLAIYAFAAILEDVSKAPDFFRLTDAEKRARIRAALAAHKSSADLIVKYVDTTAFQISGNQLYASALFGDPLVTWFTFALDRHGLEKAIPRRSTPLELPEVLNRTIFAMPRGELLALVQQEGIAKHPDIMLAVRFTLLYRARHAWRESRYRAAMEEIATLGSIWLSRIRQQPQILLKNLIAGVRLAMFCILGGALIYLPGMKMDAHVLAAYLHSDVVGIYDTLVRESKNIESSDQVPISYSESLFAHAPAINSLFWLDGAYPKNFLSALDSNIMKVRMAGALGLTTYLMHSRYLTTDMRDQITQRLFVFLQESFQINPMAWGIPKEEIPAAIHRLLVRVLESQSDGPDIKTIGHILANDSFKDQTRNMGFTNRFSIARDMELFLKRFEFPESEKNIEHILPFLMKVRNIQGQHNLLSEKSHLIIFAHEEARFKIEDVAALAEASGVPQKNIRAFKGYGDKENILKAIREAPKDTTIWFNGHGGPSDLFLNSDRPGLTISSAELAKALIARAKNHGGELADLNMENDSCFSSNFCKNLRNLLGKELRGGGLRSLPFMSAATNLGSYGYGDILLESLFHVLYLKTSQEGSPKGLKIEDFYAAKEEAAVWEDLTIFASLDNSLSAELVRIVKTMPDPGDLHATLRKVEKVLAANKPKKEDAFYKGFVAGMQANGLSMEEAREAFKIQAKITESIMAIAGPSAATLGERKFPLPSLDLFEPLKRQGGQRPEGSPIGQNGLVFAANAPVAKMLDALRAQGISTRDDAHRTLGIVQRYFRKIHRQSPETTRPLGSYKIEFRSGVASYAAIQGDKIFVDVALLNLHVPSRDLLPFLAFVLGHEGSHGLEAVGRNEKKAQAMDAQRFSAFSLSHQRAVLRILTQLKADSGYLSRLASLVKTNVAEEQFLSRWQNRFSAILDRFHSSTLQFGIAGTFALLLATSLGAQTPESILWQDMNGRQVSTGSGAIEVPNNSSVALPPMDLAIAQKDEANHYTLQGNYVSGAVEYELQESKYGENFANPKSIWSPNPSFAVSVETGNTGTRREYRVRAYAMSGNGRIPLSDWSSSVDIVFPPLNTAAKYSEADVRVNQNEIMPRFHYQVTRDGKGIFIFDAESTFKDANGKLAKSDENGRPNFGIVAENGNASVPASLPETLSATAVSTSTSVESISTISTTTLSTPGAVPTTPQQPTGPTTTVGEPIITTGITQPPKVQTIVIDGEEFSPSAAIPLDPDKETKIRLVLTKDFPEELGLVTTLIPGEEIQSDAWRGTLTVTLKPGLLKNPEQDREILVGIYWKARWGENGMYSEVLPVTFRLRSPLLLAKGSASIAAGSQDESPIPGAAIAIAGLPQDMRAQMPDINRTLQEALENPSRRARAWTGMKDGLKGPFRSLWEMMIILSFGSLPVWLAYQQYSRKNQTHSYSNARRIALFANLMMLLAAQGKAGDMRDQALRLLLPSRPERLGHAGPQEIEYASLIETAL